MIETYEKNENTKTTNIKILLTMRAFFTEVPPVLTTNLELGNLRRSNSNDFVFKDLS